MKVDILTAFPGMFEGVFDLSILRRGQDKGLVEINVFDLRKWSTDKYKSIDDRPYGGGAGMILRVDILDKAISTLKSQFLNPKSQINTNIQNSKTKTILLDAGGETYNQVKARELSSCEHLILICGHYEGVDHRVHEYLADEVISIGNYVLSGGEIPAMIITDSVIRLLPGVLGNKNSIAEESHNKVGEKEYPQFTRPEEYRGWKVPEILLGGDHAKIAAWRKSQVSDGE